MEEIVIECSIGDVSVTLGEWSFSNVDKITGDESSSDFVKKMEELIKKMNEGKDVESVYPTETPSEDAPDSTDTTDTPEGPLTVPPTLLPTTGALVIDSEEKCNEIYENTWSEITVGNDLCNELSEPLFISNNHHLLSITVGENSLQNIPSIDINNNYVLSSLVFESSSFSSSSITISSSYKCDFYIIRSSQLENYDYIFGFLQSS